jgi:hypothetical protein
MIKEGGKIPDRPDRPKPIFVQEWVPTAKASEILERIEVAHADAAGTITDESAKD